MVGLTIPTADFGQNVVTAYATSRCLCRCEHTWPRCHSIAYSRTERRKPYRSLVRCELREGHELQPAVNQNDVNFLGTLRELQGLPSNDLRGWVLANRQRVSLAFLTWLAQKESETTGSEKEQLWWLGSQLTVITEGLDPAAFSAVQDALSTAAECLLPETAGATVPQGADKATAGAAPSTESVIELRKKSLMALTPEGMQFIQQQVVALNDEMRDMQKSAVVSLVGRKEDASEDTAQQMAKADAAVRILDYLLRIPDAYDRSSVLADAFTPPPDDSTAQQAAETDDTYGPMDDEHDDGQDYLYTTPIRLLQAIDMYVMQLNSPGDGKPQRDLLLVGPDEVFTGDELMEALKELRAELKNKWL